MKTKYLKRITMTSFAAVMLLFSSCLKDNRYFNAETVPNLAELPKSGTTFFANDAITKAGVDTVTFAVGVTAAEPPATATAVTLGVDNSVITTYNAANPAIVYQPIPAAALKFTSAVTIPAGKNSTLTSLIIDRTLLDPAVSYMLPVKIISASGLPLSANFNLHYYHIIGNDWAGAYTWDYRRYNNGTGPGVGVIPSITPTATDGGTALNQAGKINPIGPTEMQMETGYNGNHVMYDVKFTKSGSGAATTYTNWTVTFDAANIAIWTAGGIMNVVPPKFTLPPPAAPTATPVFEMNHISMGTAAGSSPRYIDDSYHK